MREGRGVSEGFTQLPLLEKGDNSWQWLVASLEEDFFSCFSRLFGCVLGREAMETYNINPCIITESTPA